MAAAGSNGLLFINMSNKTASPSKNRAFPIASYALDASQPLPLPLPAAPAMPVQRYSHSIAAAAANTNTSPKRARSDPAPPPLFFPRKSKIYPVMASPPLPVTISSPAAELPVTSSALAQSSCEYEVSLPRVQVVAAETASVSTR